MSEDNELGSKEKPNKKIKYVALVLVAVLFVSVVVILSKLNPNSNNNSEPPKTDNAQKLSITQVTVRPIETLSGPVIVEAEVRNDGTKNATVLVVLQIQEPSGSELVIENNTQLMDIYAGSSNKTAFLIQMPADVKIGTADIDVYDTGRITRYATTGFIYPFTVPIEFHIMLHSGGGITYYGGFNMTVDGKTYFSESMYFYWQIGTIHTVSVPRLFLNPDSPRNGWQIAGWYDYPYATEGNTLFINVTSNGPTNIVILYAPYFNETG